MIMVHDFQGDHAKFVRFLLLAVCDMTTIF